MTTPTQKVLRSTSCLTTLLLLLGGCGSSSTTPTVDARVDGPKPPVDGAAGTATDVFQGTSHDAGLATEVAPSLDGAPAGADAPVQVDVYVPAPGTDGAISGSPDLLSAIDLGLSGTSYDTSAAVDGATDSPSLLDGSASIDSASGKAVDASAPDTTPANPDTATANPDAAGSIDSGSGGATGSGNKIGLIALSETAQIFPAPIGAIIASGAQATFGSVASSSSSCETTTKGDCQLYVCPTSSNPTTTTTTFIQAGTVTVTGLAAADLNLNLTQGTSGAYYMSASLSSYLWTSSRAATVTVTGSAAVPAFTMSLVAPSPITVTSPLPSSTMVYTISRSSDLVVTWSGGVDGTAQVNLSSNSSGTTPGLTISCNVPAAKGTVTVPASLMAGFGTSGGFTADVYNSATKNVGDWLMDFQATQATGVGTATFTN